MPIRSLYFLATILFTFEIFAETTDLSGSIVPGPAESHFNCENVVSSLRDSVLTTTRGAASNLGEIQACFAEPGTPSTRSSYCRQHQEETQRMLDQALAHQQQVHDYYRNLFPQWTQTLDAEQRRHAENCFIDQQASREDSAIVFNGVVNGLHISPTRDSRETEHVVCQRLLTRWGTYTAPSRRAYDSGQAYPEGGEEFSAILEFRNSNLMQILGDDWALQNPLDGEQLRDLFYRRYNTAWSRSRQFLRRAENWPPAERYQFYEFNRHFEEFLANQPESQRSQIEACRSESNFGRNCLQDPVGLAETSLNLNPIARNLLPAGECTARVNRFFQDNLPVIGLIDAIVDSRSAQGAFVSGVSSEAERDQEFAENFLQGMFALPTGGAVVAAGRPALVRGARALRGGTSAPQGPSVIEGFERLGRDIGIDFSRMDPSLPDDAFRLAFVNGEEIPTHLRIGQTYIDGRFVQTQIVGRNPDGSLRALIIEGGGTAQRVLRQADGTLVVDDVASEPLQARPVTLNAVHSFYFSPHPETRTSVATAFDQFVGNNINVNYNGNSLTGRLLAPNTRGEYSVLVETDSGFRRHTGLVLENFDLSTISVLPSR